MKTNHAFHAIDFEFHPLHPAKIVCRVCKTYIKWASYKEMELFNKCHDKQQLLSSWQNFDYQLNKDMIDDMHHEYYERHVLSTDGSQNIYLNVSYKEKDIVKKLGAKWDVVQKKWFIKSNWTEKKKQKFDKWIK